jgi:hypothetical protein
MLLRMRRERPRRHTPEGDELAPFLRKKIQTEQPTNPVSAPM